MYIGHCALYLGGIVGTEIEAENNCISGATYATNDTQTGKKIILDVVNLPSINSNRGKLLLVVILSRI